MLLFRLLFPKLSLQCTLPWSQNPLCTLKTCLDLPGPVFQNKDPSANMGRPLFGEHGGLWCCSTQSSESKHDFLREAFHDSPLIPLPSLEQISYVESFFFQSPHQFCNYVSICESPLLSRITSFTITVPVPGNIKYTMFNKYNT